MARYPIEAGRRVVSGRSHPARNKLVAGALAGGIALGVWAIAESAGKETVQGSVKERHLKSIALTLPVLYDARLSTNVSAQVTLHDENPLPFLAKLPLFRDLRNHTLRDTADVIVNVGTKLKSLHATPDPRTGKLTVVLHGDPDPNKSDLVLQETIDPATEKITNQGDWGDVFMNALFGAAKAVAQGIGKDFVSPVDNTNTLLGKMAHLMMYDAVASGPNNCVNLGIRELNKENSAELVGFQNPNPPKTLKQAIAQIVFDTYAIKNQQTLSPADIDVRFVLSPQGLPNPFHDELVQARASGSKEHIDLQSPASYPPCTVGSARGGH